MRGAATTTRRQRRDYVIQAVRNCLRVLAAFENEEELGVTELARRLKLHKNNVFRLLATLQEEGYVEKNEQTERYRLGISCLDLGRSYLRNRTLSVLAGPVLAELAARVGESSHLGVLSGFEVVHVAGHQPDRLVVTSSRIGQRLPAHCTALGKVLLGCRESGQLEAYDAYLASAGGLEKRTETTLVDRDKLFAHLHSVGAKGYATDLEECEPGRHAAAAPVHDAEGRVVAALSISGPAFRLDAARLEQEIVPAVLEAADRISRGLGYVRPRLA